MKRSDKLRKIIIIAVMFAVIACLVAAVIFLGNDNSQTPGEAESQETLISLSPFSGADIKKIEYSADNSDVILEKENGTWMLKGDLHREADSELADSMATALASVSAVKKINEAKLSEYGLDTPRLAVTVYLSDGKTHSYSLGITNSYNGYSYILSDGSVYMFEDTLSDYFEISTKDLLGVKDKIPSSITKNTVMSFTITDETGASLTYTNCSNMADLLSSLRTNFAFESLVSFSAVEEELEKYGLAEGQGKISIFYNAPSNTQENLLVDATFTLIVGSESDGKVYYMVEGSENIFVSTEDGVGNIIKLLMSHSEEHDQKCLSAE